MRIRFGGKREGLALVTTLWILAALAILTVGFTLTVQTDVQITTNFADEVRSRYLAQAGIHRIAAQLPLTLEPYYAGDQEWTQTDAAMDSIGFERGSYQIEVTDESGKLNVNQASTSMLTALFGDEAIAQSIRDWIDDNDDPRSLGAEDDYYMSLSSPYHCRNAPIATVNELLLVRDVTPELLLSTGEDIPTSGTSVSASSSSTTSTLAQTSETQPLRDLLTVYTEEPNVDAEGNPRVNIRTASRNQIRRALRGVLSPNDVDAIMTYRDGTTIQTGGRPGTLPPGVGGGFRGGPGGGPGGGPPGFGRGGPGGGGFGGGGFGGGGQSPFPPRGGGGDFRIPVPPGGGGGDFRPPSGGGERGGGARRGRTSRGASPSRVLAQRTAGGGGGAGARPPASGAGRPGGGGRPGGIGRPGAGGQFPGGQPPFGGRPGAGGQFPGGQPPFGGRPGEGGRPPFGGGGGGGRPPFGGRPGEGGRPPFGGGGGIFPPGTQPGGGRPGVPGGTTRIPGRGFRRIGDVANVTSLSREKLRAIADRITVTDETTVYGRVNLNTASPAVLAALPGMTAAIAQDIVNYRESQPFTSIGDILLVPSVSRTVFSRVADYVTVRSFTYRIRAQGVLRNSRIQKRIEAVVVLQPVPEEEMGDTGETTTDSTQPQVPFIETKPRIVYWREW